MKLKAKTRNNFIINVTEPSEFDPWADWSDCSKSCGGGVQQRERTCEKNTNGDPCAGSDIETATCEDQLCPGTAYRYGLISLWLKGLYRAF